MKISWLRAINHLLIVTFTATLIFTGASLPVCAAGPDPVVAQIGTEKITLSQFKAELEKLPANLKQMATDKKIQQEFLDQLATSRLLYQEGVRQGLSKDPAVVKQVEEASRKIVLAALLQKEIESRIKAPTPEEVEQYYQSHKEEFQQEKQVKAQHILVKTEAEAVKIADELKKGGDFATLAREKSSCPSAAQGGDLGFFSRNRMVKEFADAAFALKKGEISPPVKTKFGYHIIKVTDIKEASARPLDEVRTTIENKITQEQKNQIFKEYIDGLKKKNQIVLHPELI
ncbi:MAG: peptidyl-prolyl cis-trans isomerase [Deltaproteobacteria bacterium]|nr:peptidyl-prolyl cis-trans isomerase [Deltaproteobacteria bacterium]